MRLRSIIFRTSVEDEVDGELAFHVDMRTRELVAGGMDPAAARAEAVRRFGDLGRVNATCRRIARQRERDMRHAEYLEELRHDAAFALRQLASNRLFALVAIVTLAVGVGATTAMFTVVDGVLLRPFPYPDSSRLVIVWERNQAMGLPKMYASPPNFDDWRAAARSFEGLGAFTPRPFTVTIDGEPERIQGTALSAEVLPMLGVQPAVGRLFLPADDRPGAPQVVLVSHRLWQRRFGGQPGLVGRSLTINGVPHVIAGIMPAGFSFPPPIALQGRHRAAASEIWTPLAIAYADAGMRQAHYLTVIGRLRPGVTLAAGEREMNAVAGRLARQYPESNRGWELSLTGLADEVSGAARPALAAAGGAVVFVLLLACANVANLMLMRSVGRQRELAVRASLGAGRLRLVRQMLAESGVLAVLGGAAGLVVAWWGVRALVALAPPTLPRLDEVRLDPRAVGFTVLVMFGVALLCGVLPAMQAAAGDVGSWLRSRGAGDQRQTRRMRSLFVVSQVALAVVLLVGAGLLITSFRRLSAVDPGFRPAGVLTARTLLPRADFPDDTRRTQFVEQALAGIRALPDVRAAGATLDIPFSTDRQGTGLWLEGETEFATGRDRQMNFTFVTPGYFEAVGMHLVRGRGLTSRDRPGAPLVAVVNEAFARRYFPGQEAVGKRVRMGYSMDALTEIVGVVADERHVSLSEPPLPCAYAPYLQNPTSSVVFVVRTATKPATIAPAVRRTIRRIGPGVPIFDVKPMIEVVEATKADTRFVSRLFGMFAAAALLLAAVGLYGVMSYAVSERRREIGVRVALGARPGHVARLVIGRGLWLAVAGTAAGLVSARLLARFLSSLLFGVRATDGVTFALVAAITTVAALAASWLPARRALGIDPVAALHEE